MSYRKPQDGALASEPEDDADRAAVCEKSGQSGLASPKAPRTVRFWALPIVITVAVLSVLAVLYLGETLKPMTSVRHFPVAVVNEDEGPSGGPIGEALVSALDKNKFDVRVLSREKARDQLNNAQVYGALAIPRDFSLKLQDFRQRVASPAGAGRPMITIATNPRAGTLGASIAGQTFTHAIGVVNQSLGKRLSAQVTQQIGGAPLPEAVSLAMTTPIQIKIIAHRPLPDGSSNGLSAFYYSLLLLLAGFIGSVVISALADSMLGYLPRFRTLLIKWALVVVLALLASTIYLAIAKGLGMPTSHGLSLWLYGVFAIVAVGITSTSLIAVLGSTGLLVGLLLFVVLGLPTAIGTVPLEAMPSFVGLLAKFEPMLQVFLGARALLYFDGRADAGLSQAVTMTAIGLLIGLLLGAIVTRVYDKRASYRVSAAPETANAQE